MSSRDQAAPIQAPAVGVVAAIGHEPTAVVGAAALDQTSAAASPSTPQPAVARLPTPLSGSSVAAPPPPGDDPASTVPPTPWHLEAGMLVPRDGREPGGAQSSSSGASSSEVAAAGSGPAGARARISPTAVTVPALAAIGPPAAPPPPRAMIHGLTHVYQKWNNCGPSTVLMALSAFGLHLDQLEVASHLKPDREDTNVSPDEIARYARSQGLAARVRYGGDRDIVRRLVAIGLPVIAEQWIDVEHRGEMGHYRVVIGYDDDSSLFTAQDSYYGPRRTFSYDAFEAMWQPFSGVYVVTYPAADEAAVAAAVGPDWDDNAMWRRLGERTEADAAAHPERAWSWFSLGEARAHRGDDAGAVEAFDKAIAIGLPFRAFWYQFGYDQALFNVGSYDRLIEHTSKTLETMKGENLEESDYWRAMALRRLGREDEAKASFERALYFNPLFEPARQALADGP